MLWKLTLPCVLSACFFGGAAVLIATLLFVRPWMAAQHQILEHVLGLCFLFWLLFSLLTGFAAFADFRAYFAKSREDADR